jgi:hypothetical protein
MLRTRRERSFAQRDIFGETYRRSYGSKFTEFNLTAHLTGTGDDKFVTAQFG